MIDSQLKQYLKKAIIVFFGTFLAAFAGFITQIILARNLSVIEYGIFNTQITFLNFLSPCIGLGLSAYWLKIYGENQEVAKEWMPVSLKLILVTSTLISIIIIVNALIAENLSFGILLILIFYCFGQSVVELVGSKFQTEYDYNNFTFSQAAPHIIRLILIIALVLLNWQNLNNFILVYSAVGLIIILFWGPELYKFLIQKPKKSKLSKKNLIKLTYNTFPFWMGGFLYLTYMQSSILILSHISGPEKTGYYSSAFVVLSAIYLLPSVLYQKLLLPKLHNWAYHDKNKLLRTYNLGNKLMIVLGLIFSLFLYLFSEPIVLILYGDNYRQAIDVLKILCLAIPFKFISSSVGAFLSTRGFMILKVRVMIIVSIFNVIMGCILISLYSLKGAVIVTVLTEIIMMVLLLNIFHCKYKRNLNEI